ncbi:MAG TPA: DUF371 domain-containing protein [Verrucomicrobiae bacterium]|nr:DUF371 domain-containing protein [Verrucomicrobiae bacterium]
MIVEEIIFYGHTNVQSFHARTIEITKDKQLSLRGDCIIGVNANKSCKELSFNIKEKLKKNDSIIKIELIVEPYSFIISGQGNEKLSLLNVHDIVLRKSKFICDRTLAIDCNYSSLDIPREIIGLLKNSSKSGIMKIQVE